METIKDRNKNLLHQFAEAVGMKSISKFGTATKISRSDKYQLKIVGRWISIKTEAKESPKDKLERIGDRTNIDDYGFDELLEKAEEYTYNHYRGILSGSIETHNCNILKVTCPNCKGSGICPECVGEKRTTCPICNGDGHCINCGGSGKVNCTVCGGDGLCTECGGDGEGYCFECEGEGEVDCNSCNGFGLYTLRSGRQVTCRDCHGSGKIICPHCHGGNRTFPCDNCGGSGECPQCDGRGDFYCRQCDHHHNGKCNECHGSGFVTCHECSGNGKCYKCEGSTTVKCPRCNGTGKYQSFIEYNIKLTDDKWEYDDKILDKNISDFKGKIIKDLLLRYNNNYSEAFNKAIYERLDLMGVEVNGNIRSLIERIKKSFKKDEQLLDLTFELQKTDVVFVEYLFNNKSYSFYIAGFNNELVYDELPSLSQRTLTKIKNIFNRKK